MEGIQFILYLLIHIAYLFWWLVDWCSYFIDPSHKITSLLQLHLQSRQPHITLNTKIYAININNKIKCAKKCHAKAGLKKKSLHLRELEIRKKACELQQILNCLIYLENVSKREKAHDATQSSCRSSHDTGQMDNNREYDGLVLCL